jgi:hypothetical protein
MIDSEIQKGFQTISDGKDAIATAIRSKGIAATKNNTFSSLAEKINQIEGGGGSTNTALNYANVCLKPVSDLSSIAGSYPYVSFAETGEENEFKPGDIDPSTLSSTTQQPIYVGNVYSAYLDNYKITGNSFISYKIQYKIEKGKNIGDYIYVFAIPCITQSYSFTSSGYSNFIADGEYHTIDLGFYPFLNMSSSNYSYFYYSIYNYWYPNTSSSWLLKEDKLNYGEYLESNGYSQNLAGSDSASQPFFIVYQSYEKMLECPIYFKFLTC